MRSRLSSEPVLNDSPSRIPLTGLTIGALVSTSVERSFNVISCQNHIESGVELPHQGFLCGERRTIVTLSLCYLAKVSGDLTVLGSVQGSPLRPTASVHQQG